MIKVHRLGEGCHRLDAAGSSPCITADPEIVQYRFVVCHRLCWRFQTKTVFHLSRAARSFSIHDCSGLDVLAKMVRRIAQGVWTPFT